MATMPQVLKPAFNRRRPVVDSEAFKNQELEKVRFLFSPLLFVDTRYDLAGFDLIRPGEITVVDTYRFKIPNTKRIQEGTNSAEPELMWHSRLPGIIANRILSNNREDDGVPTGLCDLIELTGLNPTENPAHEALVADMQSILWPELITEGQDQLAALALAREEVDNRANAKMLFGNPALYYQTLARMEAAVQTAIAYAETQYLSLVDELSQRAAGGEGAKGRRNKVDNEDRRICAYNGKEVPVIASPLVQARVKEIQKHQAEAVASPALAQKQCENCGAMSNLIVATGRPPKLCANCGSEFEQPAAESEVLSLKSEVEPNDKTPSAESKPRAKGSKSKV